MFLVMQIKDSLGNEHGRPRNIVGETRQTFTAPADTSFDVCFDNVLTTRRESSTWRPGLLEPYLPVPFIPNLLA